MSTGKYVEDHAGAVPGASYLLGTVGSAGFPARSITRRLGKKSTSGEWILAYQADQKKRLHAIVTAAVAHGHQHLGSRLSVPKNTPAYSARYARALTKEGLMHKGFVDDPSDLCVCDISGMDFTEVKSAELSSFDSLVYLCASDNQLSLEEFETLPALQELELSLNGISPSNAFSSLTHTSFPNLLTLDLSYNNLGDDAINALGLLPALKELHLTGNSLAALPIHMSRPARVTTTTECEEMTFPVVRFSKLERLWLDDNRLTDTSTFAVLAGLRKLSYLNLDNNEIYVIPQLQLLDPVHVKMMDSLDETQQEEAETNTDQPQQDIAATESSAQKRSSENSQLQDTEQDDSAKHEHGEVTTSSLDQSLQENQPTTVSVDAPVQPQALPPSNISSGKTVDSNVAPFPELKTLHLANNLIMSSQGLLACSVWPQLKELIITGNPIVSLNNGLPATLKEQLVDGCNITIIRTDTAPKEKILIRMKAKSFKKVSTLPPPTIPKQPLLPAIEPPPPLLSITCSPTDQLEYSELDTLSEESSFSSFSSKSKNTDRESQHHEEPQNNLPGIFLTQPLLDDRGGVEEVVPSEGDGGGSEKSNSKKSTTPAVTLSVDEEFRARRKEERKKCNNLPKRYRGYEALMVDNDQTMTGAVPTDVYRCTRALQQALMHPTLQATPSDYTTIKLTKSDKAIHRPQDGARDEGPELAVSKVNQVLDQIKAQCTEVEANLADVLSKPPTRAAGVQNRTHITQRESKQLLKELQDKYDEVRGKSLEALAAVNLKTSKSRIRRNTTSSSSTSRTSESLPPLVTK